MLVCIDPGHFQYTSKENEKRGTIDYGAIGKQSNEAHNVMLASRILSDKLKRQGIDTILTREETSKPLTWDKRLQIANNPKVDLVVSIHNNAYNSDSCGIETLVSKYCKPNDDTMIKADVIHYETAIASKLRNRGLKKSDRELAILDKTRASAILVELGFISNPLEECLLMDKKWLDKVMDGLVRGICLAYKIPYKTDEPKHNVLFNGKPYTLEMENVDGRNRIYISELNKLGFKVSYEKGVVRIES